MTNTTSPKATKSTSAKNGSTDDSKKPVTVMLSPALHRRVKVMAELSGSSLSDLVESQIESLVKERLPGLLASLETGS
jgi:predicted HicB family RNase H-like nuclease